MLGLACFGDAGGSESLDDVNAASDLAQHTTLGHAAAMPHAATAFGFVLADLLREPEYALGTCFVCQRPPSCGGRSLRLTVC